MQGKGEFISRLSPMSTAASKHSDKKPRTTDINEQQAAEEEAAYSDRHHSMMLLHPSHHRLISRWPPDPKETHDSSTHHLHPHLQEDELQQNIMSDAVYHKKSLIVVVVNALKLHKHALEWALTNVVQPGDYITLIALWPCTRSRLWSLPSLLFSGECARRSGKIMQKRLIDGEMSEVINEDLEEEISDCCSSMMEELHSLCDAKKVNVGVEVMSECEKGGRLAMECQRMGATWVVLDRNVMKSREGKVCVDRLRCNVVVVKQSMMNMGSSCKVLRLGGLTSGAATGPRCEGSAVAAGPPSERFHAHSNGIVTSATSPDIRDHRSLQQLPRAPAYPCAHYHSRRNCNRSASSTSSTPSSSASSSSSSSSTWVANNRRPRFVPAPPNNSMQLVGDGQDHQCDVTNAKNNDGDDHGDIEPARAMERLIYSVTGSAADDHRIDQKHQSFGHIILDNSTSDDNDSPCVDSRIGVVLVSGTALSNPSSKTTTNQEGPGLVCTPASSMSISPDTTAGDVIQISNTTIVHDSDDDGGDAEDSDDLQSHSGTDGSTVNHRVAETVHDHQRSVWIGTRSYVADEYGTDTTSKIISMFRSPEYSGDHGDGDDDGEAYWKPADPVADHIKPFCSSGSKGVALITCLKPVEPKDSSSLISMDQLVGSSYLRPANNSGHSLPPSALSTASSTRSNQQKQDSNSVSTSHLLGNISKPATASPPIASFDQSHNKYNHVDSATAISPRRSHLHGLSADQPSPNKLSSPISPQNMHLNAVMSTFCRPTASGSSVAACSRRPDIVRCTRPASELLRSEYSPSSGGSITTRELMQKFSEWDHQAAIAASSMRAEGRKKIRVKERRWMGSCYEDDAGAASEDRERASGVRRAMPAHIPAPAGPPPLCSICQHKAPVFGKPPRRFSYRELEMATGGFSKVNFLAEGGFGSVHRGILPDGQAVAVKQHKLASSQGDIEFCSEVEVLSCAQHRNVVMLIGYCVEDRKRLLVYEFICNRSLDSHLYGNDRTTPLPWPARQKVAVGAARGLRYLHEECRVGCIIHRDMRPNNILLTHDYEPMVGDFGLARWQPDGDLGVQTRVIGTFGYLAPEYAQSGEITEKADVYSFGVVLLEIVTGRKAVDMARSKGQQCLTEWARPLLEELRWPRGGFRDHRQRKSRSNGAALGQLLDPCLQQQQQQQVEREMFCALHAASLCIRKDPHLRPRMSQVLRILEGDVIIDHPNSTLPPSMPTNKFSSNHIIYNNFLDHINSHSQRHRPDDSNVIRSTRGNFNGSCSSRSLIVGERASDHYDHHSSSNMRTRNDHPQCHTNHGYSVSKRFSNFIKNEELEQTSSSSSPCSSA